MHANQQKTIQIILVILLSIILILIIGTYIYFGMTKAKINNTQTDLIPSAENTNTQADFEAKVLQALVNATGTASVDEIKAIQDALESASVVTEEDTKRAILDRL